MLPRCPQCHKYFSVPDHLPLILPSCLHHLCSYCVNANPSCGLVKCRSRACEDGDKPQDKTLLSYDYHLLGMKEVLQYRRKKEKGEQLRDKATQFRQIISRGTVPNSLRCTKCNDSFAQLSCTSCMSDFCSSCFAHIHSTPELSIHSAVSNEAVTSLLLKNCNDHDRAMEFISLDTGKIGCALCALYGDMGEGKVVALESVQREIVQSGLLKKYAAKVNTALGRIQSPNKGSSIQSNNCQSLRDQVESHLAQCHRLLEVMGNRLLAQLRKQEEESELAASRRRIRVEEKIAKFEMLAEAAQWQIDDEFGEGINLVKLLKEMEKINEAELVATQDIGCSVVNINKSIFDNLSSHISVELVDLLTLPTLSVNKDSEESVGHEFVELLDRMREENNIMPVNRAAVKDHFLGMEEVMITHVESAASFYVVRKKDKKLAEDMSEVLKEEWMKGRKGEVKVGEMAVVYMDDEYSRVIVTKMIPGSATVSFIDQGSTSQVTLTSMMSLHHNLSITSKSALAHHCTLAGTGGTIHTDSLATRTVKKFGAGVMCRATVVGRDATMSKSTMLVSMTREDDDGNMINLLDYLVYHDDATRQEGGTIPELRVTRFFHQLPPVRIGSEHSVVVVQVNSPLEMFVVMLNSGQAEDLFSMTKDLHAEYGMEAEKMSFLLPTVGMVCVARFGEDGKFYRAVVKEVLRGRMVRVVYVDFGNSEVVEMEDIKRIKDKYLLLPAMAVKVGLADVEYMRGFWKVEATMCVRELVRNKILRMVVRKEEKSLFTCKVRMYQWKENECINMRLVQEGHAKTWKRLVELPDHKMFLPDRPDPVPGMRTPCRVVSAASPYKILIRRLCQEQQFYQLCRDLASYFSSSSDTPEARHWFAGAGCVVKLQGEGWVRAKVVREELDKVVEVFQVDYGVQEVVGVESIRSLPEKFFMSPFCWSVHLTKLVPAGAKTWTGVACEKLTELVDRTGRVVEIQVVGEMEGGSWPVEMFIEEKDVSVGPLDPVEFISLSVGESLREEGLAICQRVVQEATKVNKDGDGHVKHEVSADCIVKEILMEIIDDIEETSIGGRYEPPPNEFANKFKWLAPLLPSSSVFVCLVSHVDWDCNLHISTIPDNQDNLRIIDSVLHSKYAGSAHSQEDLHWFTGEACIAQFHLDKRWYRGMVLKIMDTEELLVKFVDYGSEERCDPCNLRKGLFMTDIPIQCFTVKMANLRPTTEPWTEEVLDFLHKTVVDQELNVSVAEDIDTFPLVVTVLTKSGLDIGKLLVKNGYARQG